MFKGIFSILLASAFVVTVSGCGSSNEAAVCAALAKATFEECDLTNSADQDTIQNAISSVGGTAPPDSLLMLMTEGDLQQLCEEGLAENEATVEDNVKAAVEAGFSAANDCDDVADVFTTYWNLI